MDPQVKPKSTLKLQAEAACPSHSLAQVSIRDLSFANNEPIERGGSYLDPTPTDTALSALIGCTNVIGHKCVRRLRIETGLPFGESDLTRLAADVSRLYPLSKLFKHGDHHRRGMGISAEHVTATNIRIRETNNDEQEDRI